MTRPETTGAIGAERIIREIRIAALAEGIPYYHGIPSLPGIALIDADPLLQSLNGYSPFEQLLRPKG